MRIVQQSSRLWSAGCVFGLFVVLILSAVGSFAGERAQPSAEALALVEQGLALEDNSEAEADLYVRAVALAPEYASAHFNLAYVRHVQGRLEEAMTSYRRVLELDPARHDAHANLAACIQAVRGDAGLYEARRHLNAAIELRQALPRDQRPEDLAAQEQQLLALEERITIVHRPVVHDNPPPEVIIAVLGRAVTRGGQTLYEGPRLAVVLFATGQTGQTGQTGLEPGLEAWLSELALALDSPRLAPHGFVIEGHADGRGPAALNERIARQRAATVRDFLVDRGIDPARLEIRSFGEDRPVFPNNTLENFRKNRRIEIVRRYAP